MKQLEILHIKTLDEYDLTDVRSAQRKVDELLKKYPKNRGGKNE